MNLRAYATVLALVTLALPARGADPNAGGATPAATPGADKRAASAGKSDDTVVLNFVNADIDAVVRAIGQFTGRTFIVDPRVKGTMTLITEFPVTRQQAFNQLLAALRLQGFALIESAEAGGVALVTPEADAKLQGGRVITPSKAAPSGDQVITQVFRLQYESATNLVPVLRPLIAPNNTISAYPANNTLVITDYAENLRRLARIIEAVDSPATAEVEVEPLKYGLASDVAAILTKILDEGAARSGQAADAGQRVSVIAEPRTNTLILRASSKARFDQAKRLIEHFDQPGLTPGNINVVYLRYAQAVRLAPLLRAVLSSDPSFMQQATGSGLTVTPVSQSLGQSSTNQPQGQTPPSNTQTAGSNVSGGMQPPGGGGGGGAGNNALAGLIQADPATNSLIVSAPEPLYRNVRSIIDRLDARPAQVMIESLVVELTGSTAAEFGIQWQDLTGATSNSTNVVGGTNFTTGNTNLANFANTNIISLAANNLFPPAPGLNIGLVQGTITIPGTTVKITDLGVLIRALEQVVHTNILARPNIQTLDNEEGKFLVGQNVALVTGQYSTTATGTTSTTSVNPFQTFDRRDIGLQLSVKPQISEGGTVRLAIYVENSSVAPGTSGVNLTLNKSSFQTNVLVEDGAFVVIAGLVQDQADETQSKVPFLGDLPFIGRFFRYDNRAHTKTQTMVFLRPTIIRDEASASELALSRYDYLRSEVAHTHQPDLPPLRDLSLEDMPLAPPQGRPKAPANSPPVQPDTGPFPQPPLPAPSPRMAPRTDAAPAPASPALDAGAVKAPPVVDTAMVHEPPATTPAPAAGSEGAVHSATAATDRQLIQVAIVGDIERGHLLQQRLKELGLDSSLESVTTAKGEIVHIRVSVERQADKIADTLSMLRRMGYDPVLVGSP